MCKRCIGTSVCVALLPFVGTMWLFVLAGSFFVSLEQNLLHVGWHELVAAEGHGEGATAAVSIPISSDWSSYTETNTSSTMSLSYVNFGQPDCCHTYKAFFIVSFMRQIYELSVSQKAPSDVCSSNVVLHRLLHSIIYTKSRTRFTFLLNDLALIFLFSGILIPKSDLLIKLYRYETLTA